MQLASTGVPVPAFLSPGDILLYASKGAVAFWIKFKTWDDVSHAELYLGNGEAAASRGPQDIGGGGVQTYPLRLADLAYVLRPNVPFDLVRMRAFHETCVGQKYALWDLVKVFGLRKPGRDDQSQCSEHVARVCREENGGPGLFQRFYDCDKVAPSTLKTSAHVELFVVKEGSVYRVEEDRALAGAAGGGLGNQVGPG